MVSARLVRILNILCYLHLTSIAKPETKKTLPLALMKSLKQPLLAAVIPRLFLIVFRYSQPTLIRESIRYINAYTVDAENSQGFWLVLSAMSIYIGLAVRTNPSFSLRALTFDFSYQRLCINTA
jgi:hypothetical protein